MITTKKLNKIEFIDYIEKEKFSLIIEEFYDCDYMFKAYIEDLENLKSIEPISNIRGIGLKPNEAIIDLIRKISGKTLKFKNIELKIPYFCYNKKYEYSI